MSFRKIAFGVVVGCFYRKFNLICFSIAPQLTRMKYVATTKMNSTTNKMQLQYFSSVGKH